MKIVIVGGVAGGATAAARLRRLDEQAEIVLLERGEYVSFANCGLPYYVGGRIASRGALNLQTPESFYQRFRVDVRVRHEVTAIFPKEKSVEVRCVQTGNVYRESYDKLILSPGATPIRPSIEGIDLPHVFTLRSIPDAERIRSYIETAKPRRAVVVGGGAIGLEMVENLHRCGLEVAVAELSEHLVSALDGDVAAELHGYLRGKGVKLLLGNAVRGITADRVLLDRGEISADLVILSLGVRPETALAASIGLTRNARGAIVVDRRMQTADPDIYAVGDAVQVRNLLTQEPFSLTLAGVANKQGRIAADNICGTPSEYTGAQGTAILKCFDMTVAFTGLNEVGAREAGVDYDKVYLTSPSHATYYPGATSMSIKVLWNRRTHRLIGAQIVGFDGVDKRMDVLATAMRLGARVEDLAALELCYAPPFGSAKDPVNMIGLVAENVITGKVRQFFWHDVDVLPRDGSVTLIDTRTPTEFLSGAIEGFRNIPLDELRNRLSEIPKERPIYLHCQSGLRSYVAARILVGHGYRVSHLAGGYRLYALVKADRMARQ